MQWTAPELPERVLVTLAVAGVAGAIVWIAQLSKQSKLNRFPTVGSTGWLGSWWDGINFMTNAADIIQEGYRKHKGAAFKVATLYRWAVVLSSRAHVEELGSAREEDFSFMVPAFEDLNAEFMLEDDTVRTPYHVTVIRSQLTRNLGAVFPEVQDEIIIAFDETLDLKGNEWKSVPAYTTIQQVVCRSTNRVFVGLPLCRDPDFLALNIENVVDIVVVSDILIGFLPKILKILAGRLLSSISHNARRGVGHLRPIIEERRKHLNEYGNDWTEKPRDLLSWVIDEAGPDATNESLTSYVLSANFLVIHGASNVFTNALYNLAAYPQHVQPLREEVEAIVEKEGWSKESLGKMYRVDSFLRETLRMESIDILGLKRKANKDFTFSDGTLIPKGTRVYVALAALHHDDTLYEDPEVFNPFRFSDMVEKDGEGAKLRFSTTSPEYLPFGHGRHACPGRFFAALGLKTMLAHLVTTYDVKLEGNAGRPRNERVGSSNRAHPTAKVMFRKRAHHDEQHLARSFP